MRLISFSNSLKVAFMLDFLSVFFPDNCHILFITFSYYRDIWTPSLSCTMIMMNLAYAALLFILFLKALIGILLVALLSPSSLDIASAWVMVQPPLYLMVNLYCWSLVSHLAFHPLDRLAVLTISSVIWFMMMVKDFTLRYCQNFSISHTIANHFFSVIG